MHFFSPIFVFSTIRLILFDDLLRWTYPQLLLPFNNLIRLYNRPSIDAFTYRLLH